MKYLMVHYHKSDSEQKEHLILRCWWTIQIKKLSLNYDTRGARWALQGELNLLNTHSRIHCRLTTSSHVSEMTFSYQVKHCQHRPSVLIRKTRSSDAPGSREQIKYADNSCVTMTFKIRAGCAKDFNLVRMTTSLGAQATKRRSNPDIMCLDRKRRTRDSDRGWNTYSHERALMDSIRPNVIIISNPWLNANQTTRRFTWTDRSFCSIVQVLLNMFQQKFI